MAHEGAALAEQHIEGLNRPFRDEDMPMLEAQQAMMCGAEFWSLKPVLLVGDAGALRARRVLYKLIADEQKQIANGGK